MDAGKYRADEKNNIADEKELDEKSLVCIEMLRDAAREKGKLPVRADFSPEEVNIIKQKLGPWPRALEAAGLKTRGGISAAEKSRQKRLRSKKAAKQRKRDESGKNEETGAPEEDVKAE